MATRVRKLARELGKSVAEVLGLLHELGYVRYRSSEDQIADVAAERVRDAARQGIQAPPVQPEVEARPRAPDPVGDDRDWMSKVLPGVVRQKEKHDPKLTPRSRPLDGQDPGRALAAAPSRSTIAVHPSEPREVRAAQDLAPPPRMDLHLEVERARLEVERVGLEALRAEIIDARSQLDRARREVAEARGQVEVARRDLEQERIEMEVARAELQTGGTPIVQLLEERGLRGADEQQRALAALAAGRHLVAVLPDLRVGDQGRFARLLEDRVVLVGGEVPASLQGVAAVTVARPRADLPDTRELEKLLHEVGEQLLLNGLRRLVVVNAAPRWHRLIREGLDRRVELLFRPAPTRDVETELTRVDAVALWRIDLPPEVRRTWQGNVGRLVQVGEPSLATFLATVRDRLRTGAS